MLRAGPQGQSSGLDAAMMLAPPAWDFMRPYLKGEPVVCVPHRDYLLIADVGVPGSVERLRQLAQSLFEQRRDAHSLSLQLMRPLDRHGLGWEVWTGWSAS